MRFKAYSQDTGGMIYGLDKILDHDGESIFKIARNVMLSSELRDTKRTELFPDGEEIYENDIVILTHPSGTVSIAPVKLIKDGALNFRVGSRQLTVELVERLDIKVIGNEKEQRHLIDCVDKMITEVPKLMSAAS